MAAGAAPVVRLWRGQAPPATADAYQRHVEAHVLPGLKAVAGYRGACVLRRAAGERVEFLVLTFWDSLAAVRGFAGDDIGLAVVEPAARAVLSEFDEFATHYQLAASTGTLGR